MDKLEELEVLVAILEEGTMAAAARKLGRSPAAVTRILGEFETRIGVRLVERTTRRLAGTEAGARLADNARTLLADYAESVHEAMGDALIPRGRLRISAPRVFGRRHLAPVVAQFLALHAEVDVDLVLDNQIVDLVQARVDVALRIGQLEDSGLQARLLGHVSRIVCGSAAYFKRHGVPADPASLRNHTLIRQSSLGEVHPWRFVDRDGVAVTIHGNSRFVVNDAETAIDAATAGVGLIRPLSYQVAKEIESGRLVRVLQEYEPVALPVNLVYISKKNMPLRVRAFIDFAASALVSDDRTSSGRRAGGGRG